MVSCICHYTDARKEDYENLSANNKYKAYALTDDDSIVMNTKEEDL